jgi:hypothetical protein
MGQVAVGRRKGRVSVFVTFFICIWFADSALRLWFGIFEPASEFYSATGQIAWVVVANRILLSFVLSATACSVLLAANSLPRRLVFGAGVVAGVILIGLGIITNSMGEYYDSSGIHWGYVALTFSGGFLVVAGLGSLVFWLLRGVRRIGARSI